MSGRMFSLRGLWQIRYMWVTVILAPFATVALISFLATTYDVPARVDGQRCLYAPPAAPIDVRLNDDGSALILLPPRQTLPTTRGDAEACTQVVRAFLHADAPSSMARSRALALITFGVGTAMAVVLAAYSCFTIGRFSMKSDGWGLIAVLASLGIAGAVTWLIIPGALPHQATKDLFRFLAALPPDGSDQAKEALHIATWGTRIVVFIGILYVLAQAAVAVRRLEDRFDPVAEPARLPAAEDDLSFRFDRLTTLSALGAVVFALAIVTSISLTSWTLSFDYIGPAFTNSATTIYALFSTYLTVGLIAAYLPTAAILEAWAGSLAPAGLAERRKWLADRGLTVITTARLAAFASTLLPLLAGAVTSASTASGVLSSILK